MADQNAITVNRVFDAPREKVWREMATEGGKESSDKLAESLR